MNKYIGDIIGLLIGALIFIGGAGLLFYWVIGTWMGSKPILGAALGCFAVGAYMLWYFGR